MPKYFRNQEYGSLKKECLKKGVLFEDLEFPANNKSLFYSKVDKDIEWMRPKELCKVPRLIVDGMSCDDLNPGELGNSWFITACSSIAQEKKIWQKVIPNAKEQEWDDKNQYAGIFRFNFWRFGQWIEVVVDDRLPTRNGKLIFCHSKTRNEFWSALLEKAYAKMFGDYESLMQGYAVDALVDFTGGVSERLDLTALDLDHTPTKKRVFEKLVDASENGALIVTKIECAEEDRGSEVEHGLVRGQGYTMTAAKLVEVKKSLQGAVGAAMLQFCRLFNPWDSREWTGAWSDGSPEWKSLAQSEWEKMGVKFQQEGEFWMCFDDFVKYFTHVDICHFVNTSFFTLKKSWNEAILHSQWSVSGRNGGGDYNSRTFLSNPQYLFDITGPQDRIMVSLEQHDVKGREAMLGQMNTIGFHIMKVEENRKYRVHIQGEKVFTSDYMDLRSVFGSCKLSKGRYVIVPSTKEQGGVGQFMLRLYTSSGASARELVEEAPTVSCPCSAKYQVVTTLTVEKCEELVLPEGAKGTLDPFLMIRCEGEKVQSTWCKETNSPSFNISATFYRKKSDVPITIEVWSHNRVIDDYVAEARCEVLGSEDGERKVLNLYGRKKEADVVKPGKMTVFVRSSPDLTYL
ncbi:calpain-5-like isoform X3 [Babylonia areolata]